MSNCEFTVTLADGCVSFRCEREGEAVVMYDGGIVVLCGKHRGWASALGRV